MLAGMGAAHIPRACKKVEGDPSPCNSGIMRIYEDPNIIPIIPFSHYYWVGGPPNIYPKLPQPPPL